MKGLTYLKKLSQVLITFWLIVGVTFFLIILSNLICGLLLNLYFNYKNVPIDHRIMAYSEKDRRWAIDYFREFLLSGDADWKSYVYWRIKPFKGKYINVDQNGIRNTYFPKIKKKDDADRLSIFMFGGSTLWGTGSRDDFTIPSLVAKYLSQRGINARVTNYGQTGYVSTQELIQLLILLQKENVPNIAVFYDGVNDTFAAFQSRAAGIPQNESNRVQEFNLLSRPEDVTKLFIRNSLENLDLFKMFSMISNKLFKQQVPRITPENRDDYKNFLLAEGVADVYLSNIKLVENLGKNRFISLFYWQPTIMNKKKLTIYERQEAEKIDWREFFELTYHIIEKKNDQLMKHNFHNISDIFTDNHEPLFLDWCHLKESGNKIIADRIARDIAQILQKDRIH